MVEQFPEYWAWRKKFNKRTKISKQIKRLQRQVRRLNKEMNNG